MAINEIQHFFDHQALGWDYSFDEQKLKRLRWIFKHRIGALKGPVLDLGCGTGVLLKVFPQVLSDRSSLILEMDLSMAMLHQAQEKRFGLLNKVYFVQADGHRLPLAEKSMNSVVAFQVLPHFIDPLHVFQEVYRTLKKDGRFVILHLMDHHKLNALHRSAGGAVEDHYLPPVEEVAAMLASENFVIDDFLEKEDCYLIIGRK
ncbi:class I SAM-dependent methyltransferase [Caldithrix abyssi]